MKIVANLAPPTVTRGSALSAPSQSFEALLGPAENRRAFGFSELGVFGQTRPIAAPATDATVEADRVQKDRASVSNPTPVERPALASASARAGDVVIEPRPEPRRPAPSAPHAAVIDTADSQSRAAVPGDANAVVSDALDIQGGEGGAGPMPALSKAFLSALAAKAGSAGRVTVAADGQGSGVQIVISAPALSIKETRDLRREAARLAVLYGLTLGGFMLNGAEVEPLALD